MSVSHVTDEDLARAYYRLGTFAAVGREYRLTRQRVRQRLNRQGTLKVRPKEPFGWRNATFTARPAHLACEECGAKPLCGLLSRKRKRFLCAACESRILLAANARVGAQ